MLLRNILIAIFPILWIAVSFIGSKKQKGTFNQEFLSLESTTSLKGFAALGIILHHITQLNTNYSEYWKGCTNVMSEMGILFTAIFFFLSGYGLVTSWKNKENYLKGFLLKRLPSVLIPFIVSNIIYFIFIGVLQLHLTSPGDIAACLTGWALLNTNTWFLVEIIMLYIVFYITFRFIPNKKISMALILIFTLGLIATSLLLGHDHTRLGGHWLKGEWWYNTTIMFFVGMCVAFRKEQIFVSFQKHYRLKSCLSIIAFIITFCLEILLLQIFGYWSETYNNPAYLSKFICLMGQTLCIFAFMTMVLLYLAKTKFGNPVINFIGKIGLELYIIHELFKVLFANTLHLRDSLLYLTVLAASIPAAVALHYLDKFLLIPFKKEKQSK